MEDFFQVQHDHLVEMRRFFFHGRSSGLQGSSALRFWMRAPWCRFASSIFSAFRRNGTVQKISTCTEASCAHTAKDKTRNVPCIPCGHPEQGGCPHGSKDTVQAKMLPVAQQPVFVAIVSQSWPHHFLEQVDPALHMFTGALHQFLQGEEHAKKLVRRRNVT